MFLDDTKREGQNHFTVPIVNPSNGLGKTIIEVNCKDNENSEKGTKVDAEQNQALFILPLIIGSVVLALVVIAIVVVAYLLYSKKKSRDQRPKKSELSGWQLSARKNFPDEVRKSFLRQKNA